MTAKEWEKICARTVEYYVEETANGAVHVIKYMKKTLYETKNIDLICERFFCNSKAKYIIEIIKVTEEKDKVFIGERFYTCKRHSKDKSVKILFPIEQ